jgi:pilus assembly protein Flp/PilA
VLRSLDRRTYGRGSFFFPAFLGLRCRYARSPQNSNWHENVSLEFTAYQGEPLKMSSHSHDNRQSMRAVIKRFLGDQTGATAIEYGLIAAGIALIIIGSVKNIGIKLNTTFTAINTQLH